MFRLLVFVIVLIPTFIMAQGWPGFTITYDFDGSNDVVSADIDNDGDLDIVGAALSEGFSWWENEGNEIFSEHIIYEVDDNANCVITSDLDEDGDVDVVGTVSLANDIIWWENDGSGIFTQHTLDEDYNLPQSVYAADLDGDGDIDLLSAGATNIGISWWENDGEENFTQHSIVAGYGSIGLDALDVDGDGDVDVLTAGWSLDEFSWWENDGNENFTQYIIAEGHDYPRDIEGVDIDGDGDIDVVGAASHEAAVFWWENDGEENFTEHTIRIGFSGAYDVNAVDLDEDGGIDVLGAATWEDEIVWWKNDGTGNFEQITIDHSFNGARSVCAADINSDGSLDVIGAANIDGEIKWWSSLGPIRLEMVPELNTVVVEAGNGFYYDLNIWLEVVQPGWLYLWTEVLLPDGTIHGPVHTLPQYWYGVQAYMLVESVHQQVPVLAPEGEYEWIMNIGFSPGTPEYSDSFPFTVTAPAMLAGLEKNSWDSNGAERIVAAFEDQNEFDFNISDELPSDYILSSAYPNPFNPATSITMSLPEVSDIDVSVFNVTGQEVAKIASGRFQPGNHSFTFNAEGLSSGLYFINVYIPGHMDEVRKVMYLR